MVRPLRLLGKHRYNLDAYVLLQRSILHSKISKRLGRKLMRWIEAVVVLINECLRDCLTCRDKVKVRL